MADKNGFTEQDIHDYLDIARNHEGLEHGCLRRHVGACLVNPDKTLIVRAVNTPPDGLKCCTVCMREVKGIESGTHHEICRAVHAEQKIITVCARAGKAIDGSTMFVTHLPCSICAKLIIDVGIKTVYYENDYPDSFSKLLFSQSDTDLIKIERGVADGEN